MVHVCCWLVLSVLFLQTVLTSRGAYENGEVAPEKCEDPENFADPQTKYLTYKTWARHLHYTHNFKGDAPPRAEKKKKTAATLVLTSPNSDVEKYKARICVKGNDQEPATPWGETLD